MVNDSRARRVGWSCFTLLVILLFVGVASHEPIRHIVQSSPLWIGVYLGFRRSPAAKWLPLPFFLIWLSFMSLMWLTRLGIIHSRAFGGAFSLPELILTGLIALASIWGIVSCLRVAGRSGWMASATLFVAGFLFQAVAVLISINTAAISHR